MALAKIVGLAVTPRIPSATIRARVPSRRYRRVRLSSQGLWPYSLCRRCSLVITTPVGGMGVMSGELGEGDGGVREPARWELASAGHDRFEILDDVPDVDVHGCGDDAVAV